MHIKLIFLWGGYYIISLLCVKFLLCYPSPSYGPKGTAMSFVEIWGLRRLLTAFRVEL